MSRAKTSVFIFCDKAKKCPKYFYYMELENSAAKAIASFNRWLNAFNSRNTEAQIAEMHFPHLRLSGNKFQWWKKAEDFRVVQEEVTSMLKEEGWHHTSSLNIEPIQTGPNKVHLAIRQSRQRADGTEYNGFDTFWIFTKINQRWGVQFRSSFLTKTNVSGFGSTQIIKTPKKKSDSK